MYEDVDESPYVYGYLCELVEANHPAILGDNNANLPRVVQVKTFVALIRCTCSSLFFIQVAAEALAMDALPPDHEVKARLVNIVKTVQVVILSLFASRLFMPRKKRQKLFCGD